MKNKEQFEIEFLDHVAIRSKDIEISASWYENVLGLTRYQMPEWGEYPIFLLAGKSGVAIFPAKTEDPPLNINSKNVNIDHYAFHVTKENFEKAKKRFSALQVNYSSQDHHYFESIYTKDPDGHTVELTTLKVPASDFYKN